MKKTKKTFKQNEHFRLKIDLFVDTYVIYISSKDPYFKKALTVPGPQINNLEYKKGSGYYIKLSNYDSSHNHHYRRDERIIDYLREIYKRFPFKSINVTGSYKYTADEIIAQIKDNTAFYNTVTKCIEGNIPKKIQTIVDLFNTWSVFFNFKTIKMSWYIYSTTFARDYYKRDNKAIYERILGYCRGQFPIPKEVIKFAASKNIKQTITEEECCHTRYTVIAKKTMWLEHNLKELAKLFNISLLNEKLPIKKRRFYIKKQRKSIEMIYRWMRIDHLPPIQRTKKFNSMRRSGLFKKKLWDRKVFGYILNKEYEWVKILKKKAKKKKVDKNHPQKKFSKKYYERLRRIKGKPLPKAK